MYSGVGDANEPGRESAQIGAVKITYFHAELVVAKVDDVAVHEIATLSVK
jgi:hypothetical protein